MSQSSANISRNMFDEAKRYIGPVAQVNKPLTDADYNDVAFSQLTVQRRLAQHTLGNGSPNDGFRVTAAPAGSDSNNFLLVGGGQRAGTTVYASAVDGRVIYEFATRGAEGNKARVRHNDVGSDSVDIDIVYKFSGVTGVFTIGETVTDTSTGVGTVVSADYLLSLIVIRETAPMTLGLTISGGLSGEQCQLDSRERYDLDVSIDLGMTTADTIATAVNAHPVASAYITAAPYGTGAQSAGVAAYTFFTQGEPASAENAGRLYGDGLPGMLVNDVQYVNTNVDTDDIHPIATGVLTTTLADDTLVDSSANYAQDELVGRQLVPNIAQPGSVYTILSNTATTIVVSASMTGVAAVRTHYRVNLSTPAAPRSDLVVVDFYLEEVSSADDSDLVHAFAAPSESMRRLKVRQIVRVMQDYSAVPEARYTDSDGTPHVVVPIATIARTATASITDAMITDIRPDVSDFVSIKQEVVEARGTRGALGDRLNQSLDAIGDILPSAAVTLLNAISPMLVNSGAGPETGPVTVEMPAATAGSPGHATAAQISKLDGIDPGAQTNPEVEDSGGSTSVTDATKIILDKNYYSVQEPSAGQALITPSNELVASGFSAETNFKVMPTDPPNNQLRVLKGIMTNNDNSGFIVRLVDTVAVTGIPAVTIDGNRRYDLVEVDDAGTIIRTNGVEITPVGGIPHPTDINASAPSPSSQRSVLALIASDYNAGGTPDIDETMIVDCRPLIRSYRPSSGAPITDHSVLSNLSFAASGHTEANGFSAYHDTHSKDQLKFWHGLQVSTGRDSYTYDISGAGFTRLPLLVVLTVQVVGIYGYPYSAGYSIGAGFGPSPSGGVCVAEFFAEYDGGWAVYNYMGTMRSSAGNGQNYYVGTGTTTTSLVVDISEVAGDPWPSGTYNAAVVVVGQ